MISPSKLPPFPSLGFLKYKTWVLFLHLPQGYAMRTENFLTEVSEWFCFDFNVLRIRSLRRGGYSPKAVKVGGSVTFLGSSKAECVFHRGCKEEVHGPSQRLLSMSWEWSWHCRRMGKLPASPPSMSGLGNKQPVMDR